MIKTFTSVNKKVLTIIAKKHSIVLSRPVSENSILDFSYGEFEELVSFLEDQSYQCWDNFKPQDVTSLGNDYSEYYDRKLKNNGYISIRKRGLEIKRPVAEENICFKFNKAKMQTFMFDLLKELKG